MYDPRKAIGNICMEVARAGAAWQIEQHEQCINSIEKAERDLAALRVKLNSKKPAKK